MTRRPCERAAMPTGGACLARGNRVQSCPRPSERHLLLQPAWPLEHLLFMIQGSMPTLRAWLIIEPSTLLQVKIQEAS